MKSFPLFLWFSYRIATDCGKYKFDSRQIEVGQVFETDLIVVLSQLRRIIKINKRVKYKTIDRILIAVDESNRERIEVADGATPYADILHRIENDGLVKQYLEVNRAIKK